MMQLTDLKLIDLCPSSLKDNPEIIVICQALQPEFDAVDSEIDSVLFIPNLEHQSDDVLEHLAWERKLGSEDGWLLADTHDKKVNLIRNAYEIKRYKGTPYAIEKSLELVGLTGTIQEWFEYGGDPYWFKIIIDGTQVYTPEQLDLLDRFIIKNKNVRSWVLVEVNTELVSDMRHAICAVESSIVMLPPFEGTAQGVTVAGQYFSGAANFIYEKIIIPFES